MKASQALRGAVPLLLILGAAGCTGSAAARDAGSAPASRVLHVGLTEWTIITSAASLVAGRDHVLVTNTGTTTHDLVITGSTRQARTPVLGPGQAAQLWVSTRAGTTLHLRCDLPGHAAAGMHTSVRVLR